MNEMLDVMDLNEAIKNLKSANDEFMVCQISDGELLMYIGVEINKKQVL